MARVLPPGEVLGEEPADPPLHETNGHVVPKPSAPHRGGEPKRRWVMFNAFTDRCMANLRPAERAVWLVLFRDTRDGLARSGQTDLAKRAGCSKRAVSSAVQELIHLGFLELIRSGGIGRGAATYRVRLPELG